MNFSENKLLSVLKPYSCEQLKNMHLILNHMYHTILFGEDELATLDEINRKKLKVIEKNWIHEEKRRCYQYYNVNKKIQNCNDVAIELKKHTVYNHPLFDFLHIEANKSDLKQFLLNESVLNLEFFDYLALSMIGVSDIARSEIMANLWDEAGQGDISKFHTTMFRKILTDLNLSYNRELIITNMDWEGLAGINLFSYLSLYSFNKMTYFGFLAATEMLDPPHYHKLLKGINRLTKDQAIDSTYYQEHEKIDILHADSWLRKIILPELIIKPHKLSEFWLGFYLRLESAKRYYDKMYSLFIQENAA